MAIVTKPIALDETLHTTENPSRNIADVLAEELARIAGNILPPNASQIAYDNTESDLTATNVQDAIDEVISSQADVIADTMADLTENKTATVTDGVADFETIDGSLVKSLVVEIEPSQSGSGTPSPSNIRPISGYTEEIISVKDSTDTTQATYTTPFNQTVYGGTLDVLTGELTIDRAMAQITANNITFNATNNRAMLSLTTASLPSAVNNFSGVNCIADRFEGISNQSGASTGVGVYANNAYVAICGYKTSLAEYQAWLTDNPVTVVYEIATPQTIQLTPQTVKSLVGENHISASTGDVLECKFSMLINGDDLEMLLS